MRRWHGERIVFIGDAAHATSPQLGHEPMVPTAARRVVRTMAGLDRGIVRSAISLDDLRRLALPARVVAAASG